MDANEVLFRALALALEEAGFGVEARRDFKACPFVVEVTRAGSFERRPWGGKRRLYSVVLAEMDDLPGMVEVCTHHDQLENLKTLDLADPGSLDKLVTMLNGIFDEFTL